MELERGGLSEGEDCSAPGEDGGFRAFCLVEGTAKTLGERLREMERKASGGGREGGAGKRKATKKVKKAKRRSDEL